MFVQLDHWRSHDGRWDDTLHLLEAELLPLLERQPGFMRLLVAGDATSGSGVVIVFWQSEAHEQTYRAGEDARSADALLAPVLESPRAGFGYTTVLDREF